MDIILNFPGIFPEPHSDPVIQIANMVKIQGTDEPFIRNCFALGETAPIIGTQVISCRTEEELLEVIFLQLIGKDFLLGYL